MAYRPFPIADPRFGLVLSREPWRAPRDAFRLLENSHIFRGRVEKKRGSALFGQIRRRVSGLQVQTGNGGTAYTSEDPGGVRLNLLCWPSDNPAASLEQLSSSLYDIVFTAGAQVARGQLTQVGSVFYPFGDPAPPVPDELRDGEFDLGSAAAAGSMILPFDGRWKVVFDAAVPAATPITVDYEFVPHDEVAVVGETVGTTIPSQVPGQSSRLDFQLSNRLVKRGTLSVTAGAETMSESLLYSGGNLLYLVDPFPPPSFDLDPLTGRVVAVFETAPAGTAVTCSYTYLRPHPVAGLERYLPPTGGEELLALSHRRAWRYNTSEERFVEVDAVQADPFPAGARDDTAYWSAVAKRDSDKTEVLLLVTDLDPPRRYIPPATLEPHPANIMSAALPPEPPVDTGKDILGARMVFVLAGGFLIYLSPRTQDGEFRRRAWWTKPNLWEQVGENNFADAPTEDQIQSAALLRNELFVFFTRSIWRLRDTGIVTDETQRFAWERVSNTGGSIALRSTVALDDTIVTLSRTGPLEFNGRDVVPLAELLGDFVLSVDPASAKRAQAVRVPELRQVWIGFPKVGSSFADRVLGNSLDERSVYFLHDTAGYRCFSPYEKQRSLIVDDVDQIVDTIEFPADSEFFVSGFPLILAGRDDGQIEQIPGLDYCERIGTLIAATGLPQTGSAIAMMVETQGLNPFLDQDAPRLARLGVVQLFLEAQPGASLTVELQKDSDPAPYRTLTVPLDPRRMGQTKLWLLLDIGGVIAYQHVLRFKQTATGKAALDAIVPWFDDGGRIVP